MKAVLQFKLPEENEEFKMALSAENYHGALSEIGDALRSSTKYGDSTHFTPDEAEKFKVFFYKVLNDHEISI